MILKQARRARTEPEKREAVPPSETEGRYTVVSSRSNIRSRSALGDRQRALKFDTPPVARRKDSLTHGTPF